MPSWTALMFSTVKKAWGFADCKRSRMSVRSFRLTTENNILTRSRVPLPSTKVYPYPISFMNVVNSLLSLEKTIRSITKPTRSFSSNQIRSFKNLRKAHLPQLNELELRNNPIQECQLLSEYNFS